MSNYNVTTSPLRDVNEDVILSHDATQYIENCWGLKYSEQSDEITMLWSSCHYSAAAYLLFQAGGFSEDGTPKEIYAEVKTLYEKLPESEVKAAIDQCLEGKYPDYRIYYCKKCSHVHFINCLYFKDVEKEWSCDSCNEPGPLTKE